MASAKILVIIGTVRQGRVGRKIADWYLGLARAAAPELEFDVLDVAELDLPLFSEPIPPGMHQYSPTQNKLAQRVSAADGFVFVTGEYNHSMPGSLKNFMDYIAAEWARKPAAFVGYGGAGGVRAIEHLVQVLCYLGVASLGKNVSINAVWEALDDKGVPKPGYVFGDVAAQLKELSWWAQALKKARG